MSARRASDCSPFRLVLLFPLPDEALLGLLVVVVDEPPAKILLLLGREEGDLVDLLHVDVQIGLDVGSGHGLLGDPGPRILDQPGGRMPPSDRLILR